MRFGSVELEKFRLASTRLGMACSVDVSVIVLPEPGGPQRMRGLWEASHALSTSTCLQSRIHNDGVRKGIDVDIDIDSGRTS